MIGVDLGWGVGDVEDISWICKGPADAFNHWLAIYEYMY